MEVIKKHKRLTVEELRSCKGFENISEEEAEEVILLLEKLSILFYELYMKQKMQKHKLINLKDYGYEEQRKAA
jgi:hypothetical protein